LYFALKRAERVAQASALGSPRAAMPAGDVISGHYCRDNARSPRMPADDVTSGHQQAMQFQLAATRDSLPDALRW